MIYTDEEWAAMSDEEKTAETLRGNGKAESISHEFYPGEWRIVYDKDRGNNPYVVQQKQHDDWQPIWVYPTLEGARNCWRSH